MTLFEDMSTHILRQIESGQYQAGEQLPPEGQLQKDYGVSRTTVRKAIDVLVDQHKVVRKKGVGLFVAPSLSTQNILEMTGVIKPYTYQKSKLIVKEAYLRQAGNYYSKKLQIKPAELIYYISFLEV
ncbi:GntR family transcriptional regulator, partial [Lactobacillus sp. XV13L]|nr:GntR family transcriptional regulator [Lactobacillus sp. XV13L]